MSINATLPWIYDLDEATRLQEHLSKRLSLTWDNRPVTTIAGIVVSYSGAMIQASINVYRYPELTRLANVTGQAPETFPYIPGLLAFRVGPAILDAWERMKLTPDLVMIHGHGIAHPRGFGLASHVGLWLNLPTIGIAKTRLYGAYAEVGAQVGDWSELWDEKISNHLIGAVLRTQRDAKPIYISPGHLIDLPHSIEFVLACSRAHRLPDPLALP